MIQQYTQEDIIWEIPITHRHELDCAIDEQLVPMNCNDRYAYQYTTINHYFILCESISDEQKTNKDMNE